MHVNITVLEETESNILKTFFPLEVLGYETEGPFFLQNVFRAVGPPSPCFILLAYLFFPGWL